MVEQSPKNLHKQGKSHHLLTKIPVDVGKVYDAVLIRVTKSCTIISGLSGEIFFLNCDPCIFTAVSTSSVIKIEFGHFRSRQQIE